jgi:dihydrofolate synthase/folylpolyglutamate synthase
VEDPHRAYPVLHVGGTNGKGSVAAVLASALREGGHRVGLYTSPHLVSFAERIQVNGCPVSLGRLEHGADLLRPALEREGCSFFEAATVLAFTVFREEAVDVAIVEVGLGGRLDSTNVVTPEVIGITNVAMDHREYLGDDLGSIASEKAGILKAGVPAVTAEVDPRVLDVFRNRAEGVGADLLEIPAADPLDVEVRPDGTSFRLGDSHWGPLSLEVPLPGPHQARNATLAVRMLERLPRNLRPGAEAVVEGLARARWPGRVQVIQERGVTFVLDVAHNFAGVGALTETLGSLDLPRPVVLLVGILGDKDWRSMLPPLFDIADGVVLTQPHSAPTGRRWDPSIAAEASGSRTALEILPDFSAALSRASTWAGSGTVVVTGSVHTVGDALGELGVDPFPGC